MGDHILIVDDQPGIVLLLKEILESDGYEITTASTGKEALQAIHNHTFDLIILDYRLPIVNGFEIVKQLQKENQTVPIIMMSGLPEKVSSKIKEYKQIVAMLAKPFNITEVSDLVRENIAHYK